MASKRAPEVEKLRGRIDALKASLAAAADMSVPIKTAYARADAVVDDLAESGAVDGSTFASTDYSRPLFRDADDVLEFLAWIGADQIKTKLRGVIDDHYAGFDGSLDTRETRAAIAADTQALFELEVEEERLILASEAEGQPIRRRTDADPRAVLAAH